MFPWWSRCGVPSLSAGVPEVDSLSPTVLPSLFSHLRYDLLFKSWQYLFDSCLFWWPGSQTSSGVFVLVSPESYPWEVNHNIGNVGGRQEEGPLLIEGLEWAASPGAVALLQPLSVLSPLPPPWVITGLSPHTVGRSLAFADQNRTGSSGLGAPRTFSSWPVVFPEGPLFYRVVQTFRTTFRPEWTFVFLLKYLLVCSLHTPPHFLSNWFSHKPSTAAGLWATSFYAIGLIHSLSASLSCSHWGRWNSYVSALLCPSKK